MQPSALRAAEQDRSGCTFAEATRQQDFGLQAHPQDSCRPGSPAPFAAADRDFTKQIVRFRLHDLRAPVVSVGFTQCSGSCNPVANVDASN